MVTQNQTNKPSYKILGRFITEFIRFSKNNKIPWRAIPDFPAYLHYNKSLKNHAEVGLPWISYGALKYLESYLKSPMSVLEFGCGGSTLYFSRKVSRVISIEDNKEWYEIMERNTATFPGVELRLISQDDDFAGEEYSSNMPEFKGISYRNYVNGASDIDEESIDVLVIDGRSRISCLRENLPKLKKNGVILFDNSDRQIYQEGLRDTLKDWKRKDFSGVTVHDWMFSQTSIFSRK